MSGYALGGNSPLFVRVAQACRRSLNDMLQLRPNCECCDRDLSLHAMDAFICTFECTFCSECANDVLKGKCPNCGGELVRRPRRAAEKLLKFPASTERVVKAGGCEGRAFAIDSSRGFD